ncbi:helix-turn-helix domain-containing protein [Lachnospiraceae bacterium MD1]|jgi:xylan 1,4-beta-xylosidase|uniref:Helix-turn-helix domain-containing protein n=1 Tax=Variimorphobacter saccharofermentans TaxID=2755051 RepID=A0A839K2Y5_9FIRM|nr:helix-turn-helix domain-containing protein [Variimorphobacter saccharofermentans]MBB2183359.1 helix-turn-helix domain-containing protein [Variimorphobacter saccharofermentans]
MKFMHENVEFIDEMPINISIKSLAAVPKHWHNCIEIYLVLSGKLSITSENETYHLFEDDIILINCDQIHEIHDDENVVVVIQINPSYYKRGLDTGAYFQCNSTVYHNKMKFHEIKRIIAKIIHIYYNDKGDNDLLIISFSYQLVLELLKNFQSTEEKSTNLESKSLQRLGDIIQYINDNYSESITLDQLAERESLSPSYLSHFFRLNMGVTFFNYITGVRMNHAVNDLISTSLTIEQIAANNGFANSRYFVSAFKKQFGMLPRQFRANQKKGTVSRALKEDKRNEFNGFMQMKHHDFLNKLGEYLDTDSASEVTGNVTVKQVKAVEINTNNNIKTLSHTFLNFISVGRAKEILMESIQQQLRTIQKDVGFRYIKFHGILDDSMMLYNEDQHGNPFLTYQYVDQIIDFLLSINIKPLIQLSFMPKALAKDPSSTIFYNPVVISEPKDHSKWSYLITNLTQHFIDRYGIEEVRSWLFSFWNAPFKTTMFSFDTNEIGYELYKITWACVKSCDSHLKFGTPSYTSLDFDCQMFYDFLDYCKENQCPPDFYNVHCYPVKNPTSKDLATFGVSLSNESIIVSEDPDYMKKMITCFKKDLTPYPKLPIYITEWAPTSSHRDWLNDTCYRSSYIVKNILENYDEVDSFSSWCLSDSMEELPLDNDLFHGELGLFTCNGIKKPAYYAYTFLKKLLNTLLDKGPGYFVTTNQKGDYAILLYNYIHISPLYAQGVLFNVTFIERYNAFVDPSPMEFDLVLTNADNSPYTLTEQIVNRQSGSAFDEWVRMGAMPLTTEEEVNLLKGRSMPGLIKSEMEIKNKQINYYAKLEPHEIRLILINKKHSN